MNFKGFEVGYLYYIVICGFYSVLNCYFDGKFV